MERSYRQFMVNLMTRDNRWSVPSTPYSLNGSTLALDLNSLIKTLLSEDNDNESDVQLEDIEFDFIINGKLLRVSLGEFVESEGLNAENQLDRVLREVMSTETIQLSATRRLGVVRGLSPELDYQRMLRQFRAYLGPKQ